MDEIINNDSKNNDIQQPITYPQAKEVHNQHTLENYGDIGTINTVNVNITGDVLPSILAALIQKEAEKKINITATPNICTDYYNLIVQGWDGNFESPFIFDPRRALTEGMTESLKNQFSTLDPNAIRILYTFPTLFATENKEYGHTDEDHEIGFGFIQQIKVLPAGIKIYPDIRIRFPQQRCNENLIDLGFYGDERGNELNRTHWTIKQLDLIAELREMGLSDKLSEIGL